MKLGKNFQEKLEQIVHEMLIETRDALAQIDRKTGEIKNLDGLKLYLASEEEYEKECWHRIEAYELHCTRARLKTYVHPITGKPFKMQPFQWPKVEANDMRILLRARGHSRHTLPRYKQREATKEKELWPGFPAVKTKAEHSGANHPLVLHQVAQTAGKQSISPERAAQALRGETLEDIHHEPPEEPGGPWAKIPEDKKPPKVIAEPIEALMDELCQKYYSLHDETPGRVEALARKGRRGS